VAKVRPPLGDWLCPSQVESLAVQRGALRHIHKGWAPARRLANDCSVKLWEGKSESEYLPARQPRMLAW